MLTDQPIRIANRNFTSEEKSATELSLVILVNLDIYWSIEEFLAQKTIIATDLQN